MKIKPDIVEDQHLDFLDDLRESGETNMVGAGKFLQRQFDASRQQANEILSYWMETFSERHKGEK
jgi:hypothetical protein